MNADDLMLAELLCARLCHDLAGAVGAAAAGAELLDDGYADPETIALVAASAGGVAARLKFLRAAFGPGIQPQSAAALEELISAHLASSVPVAGLDWAVADDPMPADTARLLLNLVLVARDALPKGGSITVRAAGGALAVTARGAPAQMPEEVRTVMAGTDAPQGPRGGQALLVRRLAEKRGGEVVATVGTGVVDLRFQPNSQVKSRPDGDGFF